MAEIPCTYELYTYTSTRAAYDPVMTFFVCAPDAAAATRETAEAFAESSGWKDLAEEHAAFLVIPIVGSGWASQPLDLIPKIYAEIKNAVPTRSGKSLYNRGGFLWCWETLVYLAGYEEGAVFAGNTLVAYPNHFAAAALVNGVPSNYANGDCDSDHWLVRQISADYSVKNHDIPVALWLLNHDDSTMQEAIRYFSLCNRIDQPACNTTYDSVSAKVLRCSTAPAQQIRVSTGSFSAAPELSQTLVNRFFHQTIRWKDGPDGKLTSFYTRSEFLASGRFERRETSWNGNCYEYLVHYPAGLAPDQCHGLPLVFSVHGRGEPAWMFAEKNGWDLLADETKAFILVVPDSPENIWFFDRDGGVFEKIIAEMADSDAIDRNRVYLTGFSNGGMITREVSTHFPTLFAGISPWNAPPAETAPTFSECGCQLPCFMIVGDNDAIAPVDHAFLTDLLKVNACPVQNDPSAPLGVVPSHTLGADSYTHEKGYLAGDRFTSYIFDSTDGISRVAVTVMRDMPHGAIHDESRAAWTFLQRFYRLPNHSAVCVSD